MTDTPFARLVATVGSRDRAQQIVDHIAPAGLTAEDALAAIAAFALAEPTPTGDPS